MLFGGRTRSGRVSELYIFNFDTTTWSGPYTTDDGPEPRSLHTCTRLHDNSVLLLGGMDKTGNSVNRQWRLNTATAVPTWERVSEQGNAPARAPVKSRLLSALHMRDSQQKHRLSCDTGKCAKFIPPGYIYTCNVTSGRAMCSAPVRSNVAHNGCQLVPALQRVVGVWWKP